MRKVSSSDRLWSSLFGQLLFSPQLLIQKRSHSQTTGFQNFFVTIYLYFKLLNFTKHILDSFGYNCFIRSFIWCSEIFHRFFFLLLCVFLKCGTDYNLKIKESSNIKSIQSLQILLGLQVYSRFTSVLYT